MPINPKLYPAEWERMRQEALERAEYCCEECGMPDGTEYVNPRKPHPFFPEGKVNRMWLQLCHKQQYRTWDREAETMMLCPPCHRRFDRRFRRKHSKHFQPCGLVLVFVQQGRRWLLASEAWCFDDLFEVIASFSEGMVFEVRSEILMHVVGIGRYRRESAGVSILREKGACASFGVFLQEVLQGVVV